ncbi:carboxypeptidase regulatory-like domain-containing protein [Nocardioides sp. S-58]|uniref:alpha-amylase n=1 Tax=Nocardioides renjunii TaxID=3095075 RepID=A0ABU5K9G7_9ACTN|nr:carboxypeptidase regulatory-like domain-containing protein [Nocardioides sp. S-58]MDZ5661119.1 carboxypeptidase regulatory-like domain-containing protein [Nocardioides sp. S-58]
MRALIRPVLASAFGLLLAGLTTVAPAPVHAAGTGGITGAVTADGGSAVASIQVTAYRWTYGAWTPVSGSTTDSNGSYTLPNLDAGTYRLGFTDYAKRYFPEYYANEKFVDVAKDVGVVDGEVTSGIDAALARAGSIGGTVTKGSGAPAPGVEVQAYVWDISMGSGWWRSVASATTGPEGTYVLPGLDANTYRVGFRDTMYGNLAGEFWDNALTREAATPITLTRGQEQLNRDAHLVAASHITGRALDGKGLPVEGLVVSAYQKDPTHGFWTPVSSTRTSASGMYDIGRLAAGTYRVGFKHETNAFVEEFWPDADSSQSASDVQLGAESAAANTDVVMEKPAKIAGTVTTSTGAPIVNAYITARRWNPTQQTWDFVSAPGMSGSTNASGQYALPGLRPGRYRLSFFGGGTGSTPYMAEWWDNQQHEEDATPIELVEEQSVSGLTTVLERGSTISGTVRRTDASPVEGIEVVPHRWIPHRSEWRTRDWGSWTEENGTFDLSHLMTGTYRLAFRHDDKVVGWWGGGASLESATSIVVGPDATLTGRDATLDLLAVVPGPGPSPTPTPTPSATPTGTPTATPVPTPTTSSTPDVASQVAAAARGLEVAGKPTVGRTVKVTNLVTSLRTNVAYSFQWYAGKQKIKKATGSSLKVTAPLRGKKLKVSVTLRAGGVTKAVNLNVGKVR